MLRYAPVLPCGACRKALATKLKQMGFELPAEQLNDLFKRFKVMADKKKVSESAQGGV